MRSSMEWRLTTVLDQKSFQFPMEWDWRNWSKIREDNWSCIEVKLRVRRIPSMLETSGILGNLL